jgi:CheY-like chemotaxis protein
MPDHILVVDDNSGIRVMLTLLLADEGYEVRAASNGAEALQAITHDPPALVLLDLMMPVLDGWGVVQQLREQHCWVPTIVMTAGGNAARWCAELGADGYLDKPFQLQDLLRTVQQVRSLG